ncbi:MAG: class I SAM-dependent methyltransferase, partial [Gemmatimonadales bacterium]
PELHLLDQVRFGGCDRILFVECGDGWGAEEAWRRAQKAYVFGVDRSRDAVACAERLRRIPGRLEFSLWDGRHLPCADQTFDKVIAAGVLGRARNPAAVLMELRRVLRAGGECYFGESGESPELVRLGPSAGFTAVRTLRSAAGTVHQGEADRRWAVRRSYR